MTDTTADPRPDPLPDDGREWLGRRVRALTGNTREPHGVGEVLAFLDGPVVVIRTDYGKTFTWAARLCDPAGRHDFDPNLVSDEVPVPGGGAAPKPAGWHAINDERDQLQHMLGSLIYRITGVWSPGRPVLEQYAAAIRSLDVLAQDIELDEAAEADPDPTIVDPLRGATRYSR